MAKRPTLVHPSKVHKNSNGKKSGASSKAVCGGPSPRSVRLISLFAEELERLFWKRSDATKQTKKIQELFNESRGGGVNERKVQSLINNLRNVPPPDQIKVRVVLLDGRSHDIPIPKHSFIESVTETGELLRSMTTIADIKSKVEEICGVQAVCQMLYAEGQEQCFEDCQTIKEAGTSCINSHHS
jgi:hypothetical protein